MIVTIRNLLPGVCNKTTFDLSSTINDNFLPGFDNEDNFLPGFDNKDNFLPGFDNKDNFLTGF
jgi:hypothetical protein